MGIFNRIKKALGLEVRKGFRRWSTSELEEKKAYLENKSAEEFTAKDHHLSAEWVIQRYLPVGEEPTPEQWSEVSGGIQQKIDINLNKAAAGELLKTEYMQPARYTLTKDDFLSDIVPAFSRFDWLPNPHSKDWQGREIWESLYEFTQPYSFKHGEAKDALMSICDTYQAMHLVMDLARTYSQICQAQLDGSTRIKVVCSGKHCDDCMTLVGTKLGVDELLATFKNGVPKFPHPLHYEDEVRWCPAPFLSPESPLKDDDDPEFHAFLVDLFDGPEKHKDKSN